MLRALLTENHRRVIIDNNDSNLQLATPLKIRDQRSAGGTSRYDFTYVGQEYDGLHTFQGHDYQLRKIAVTIVRCNNQLVLQYIYERNWAMNSWILYPFFSFAVIVDYGRCNTSFSSVEAMTTSLAVLDTWSPIFHRLI
jgi:hypothetical protein